MVNIAAVAISAMLTEDLLSGSRANNENQGHIEDETMPEDAADERHLGHPKLCRIYHEGSKVCRLQK
jgi:hypothetical protein